jgi:hypothetical protein
MVALFLGLIVLRYLDHRQIVYLKKRIQNLEHLTINTKVQDDFTKNAG